MQIEWTTVIASTLVAVVVTSANYITTRYLGRLLDKIEKNTKDKKGSA